MGITDIDARFFPLIGVSFTSFMLIYEKIGPYCSRRWFSKYKDMTIKEKLQWDNKIASTIHSMAVSLMFTLCYLLESEEFFRVKLWTDSPVVKTNICIIIGYMFADSTHMIRNRAYIGNVVFVLHHMVSIWPLWYSMSYRIISWYANFRTIAELSTLFINLRWFVDTPLQYSKTSTTYILIGVGLTVSFILTRIVTIPFYYYVLYTECSTYTCTPVMLFWMITPCLVLDGLGLWWFRRVVAGFKKIIWESWFKNKILKKLVHANGTANGSANGKVNGNANGSANGNANHLD